MPGRRTARPPAPSPDRESAAASSTPPLGVGQLLPLHGRAPARLAAGASRMRRRPPPSASSSAACSCAPPGRAGRPAGYGRRGVFSSRALSPSNTGDVRSRGSRRMVRAAPGGVKEDGRVTFASCACSAAPGLLLLLTACGTAARRRRLRPHGHRRRDDAAAGVRHPGPDPGRAAGRPASPARGAGRGRSSIRGRRRPHRTTAAGSSGSRDSIPAPIRPRFGVLVLDLAGTARGVMIYESEPIRGRARSSAR